LATQKKNTGTAKKTTTKAGSRKNTGGTARKQNNARQTTRRGTKTAKQTKKKGESMSAGVRNEVMLLVVFAIVLICMLSVFGLCGKFGQYISDVLFGIFGVFAYVMPILVFAAIAFYVSNIGNTKAIVKLVAAIVGVLDLCGFMQLLTVPYDASEKIMAAYEKKAGGGLIGGAIQHGLCGIMDVVGAYIVIIFILLACIVIISERSIIGAVQSGSEKAYRTAKEDIEHQKERNEERRIRREEERRERELQRQKEIEEANRPRRTDHKVRGVAIGARVVDEETAEQDLNEAFRHIQQQETKKEHFVAPWEQAQKEPVQPDTEEQEMFVPDFDAPTSINYVDEKVEQRLDLFDEEEKLFEPKEQIIVSEAAKNEMKRKPFSNEAMPVAEEKPVTEESAPEKKEEKPVPPKPYVMPSTSLLNRGHHSASGSPMELQRTANKLQETLQKFGVNVTITDVSRGPSVTRYELLPEPGTRVSKITSLTDDIKLHLAATDIRMEAPIPGKSAIGIEVPNQGRDTVYLRELVESQELKNHPSKIAFAAGKDIAGKVIVGDIAKMPHMLIAGTTGSGKSVFTNSIIMSILFRAKPTEVKMIIVDPKVVEFGVYNGIPHLLIPVVTDPKKAAGALSWAVGEMTRRYKLFADANVRDLKGYNEKIVKEGLTDENDKPLEKLPQIVIIIDELADLMMVAAKEVEESICRLAQLARAAGIHLVIATQRPSVDVVTGLIKANIPSRVALLVSSGTDSRTIIDMNGAEKLLGNGDMLFAPSGYAKPIRVQGAFVSDEEVQRVVNFLTNQNPDVKYNESLENHMVAPVQQEESEQSERDPYFEDAGRFVIEKDKASTSMLQRMFKVGFNRAARIMEQLAEAGVVGEEEGTKPRKVLMTMDEFNEMMSK